MMRLATKHANRSSYYFRLGAVIVKGNRVLSCGHNSISHCSVNDFKNSRHAEMDAILKLIKQQGGLSSIAGSTLYVSRITKTGTGMAKPCIKCTNLARSVGVKEVVYTTDNNTTERFKL
jgi:deoxycytidylate deaminase